MTGDITRPGDVARQSERLHAEARNGLEIAVSPAADALPMAAVDLAAGSGQEGRPT